MKFTQLSRRLILCYLSFLCCSHMVFAETIYQWTDPWGHVKYSTSQVPGSMVSELTELPKTQEVTEQQKQEAMVKKMQQMNKANTLSRQKKSAEKFFKQQNKKNENHCRKLRNLLADVKLRNTRKYYLDNYYSPGNTYYQGRRYFSGRYDYYPYDFLENDLYWEIREYCH